MARTLAIALKFLAIRKPFQITDDRGDVLYECTWDFAWVNPPWKLLKNGESAAVIRRKVGWSPTWDVSTTYGDYQLKRKTFTVRPRLWVEGGPYDGAELTGSLFATNFTLLLGGATVAEARRQLLSLTNRYEVELIEDTPENELLTAVLMATVFIESIEAEGSDTHSSGS
jgi:uncharacterized protein YxjI